MIVPYAPDSRLTVKAGMEDVRPGEDVMILGKVARVVDFGQWSDLKHKYPDAAKRALESLPLHLDEGRLGRTWAVKASDGQIWLMGKASMNMFATRLRKSASRFVLTKSGWEKAANIHDLEALLRAGSWDPAVDYLIENKVPHDVAQHWIQRVQEGAKDNPKASWGHWAYVLLDRLRVYMTKSKSLSTVEWGRLLARLRAKFGGFSNVVDGTDGRVEINFRRHVDPVDQDLIKDFLAEGGAEQVEWKGNYHIVAKRKAAEVAGNVRLHQLPDGRWEVLNDGEVVAGPIEGEEEANVRADVWRSRHNNEPQEKAVNLRELASLLRGHAWDQAKDYLTRAKNLKSMQVGGVYRGDGEIGEFVYMGERNVGTLQHQLKVMFIEPLGEVDNLDAQGRFATKVTSSPHRRMTDKERRAFEEVMHIQSTLPPEKSQLHDAGPDLQEWSLVGLMRDKGRGEPCKRGERATTTGCIPRSQAQAGSKPAAEKPKVEDVTSHLQGLFDKGGLSYEDAQAAKDMLMSMTVADIKAVKANLGLKASGNKQELADQISQLAMWKLDNGPSPFGGKYGRGRDGAGRGGAGGEDAGDGRGMAPEAGRSGDEAAGGAGTDDDQSADSEAAAAVSAAQERILKRVDRYKEVMQKKGLEAQADWMTELASHIEELGAEGALAALGEEKASRATGDKVQYVGAYDDIVGGVDKDSQFIKKYLDHAGITLAGSTIDPNQSVISSWSRQNIAAEGREVPETPGGYVPTDQTFKNKLEESQALPGLESSEDIHEVMGKEVTHFTSEVVKKLDEKYGKGSWIVKSYGEEAYAGFGIFFPQRVKQIKSDARASMSDARSGLNERGYKIAKKEGKVVGVRQGGKVIAVGTPEYAKLGKRVQKLGRQAVQASHAVDGAVLPSSPEDSLKNDYGISFKRDEDGIPVGIVDYDGKEYGFDDPKIEEVTQQDGGAAEHAIHRAQEADEWRRKGFDTKPRFMVQPAFKAVGVTDADRAAGATWETAKEGRVHCVTRNGKASAVPYATLVGRGDDLPAVFHSEDSRAMEKAVEEAINQLPESERAGQMYAPDVMKTKDGWKVIELNPSAVGGGSDWLGRNPFVIDAVVSHLTDREPQHVKFVRDLLRKEGVKLPPKLPEGQGKPGAGSKSWKGWLTIRSNGSLRYLRKCRPCKRGERSDLVDYNPKEDKSFFRLKGRGQPCKQGERAAITGCIPATDTGGRRPPGKEGAGQHAPTGAAGGTVYTVKHGSLESKYSLHANKRIDGPSIPLKNYKQQDDHSCGFVAALTLSRLLQPEVTAKDVLKVVRPTKSGGVDGKSLRESLKKLGIDAQPRKDLTIGSLKQLVAKGAPVLLTVYPEGWSSDHWTVVQGFDDERIYLTNYRSLPIAQFIKEWFDRGEGLVCRPRAKAERSLGLVGKTVTGGEHWSLDGVAR